MEVEYPMKVGCSDLVMNDEQRVLKSFKDQLESLILAQNERWRQA